MNKCGEPFSVVFQHRDRPMTVSGKVDAAAGGVDERLPVREPEEDLERHVAERAAQRVADALWRCPLELQHEVPDACACEPGPQEADQKGDRESDEGGNLPPEEVLLDLGWRAAEGECAFEHGSQRNGDRRQQERCPRKNAK